MFLTFTSKYRSPSCSQASLSFPYTSKYLRMASMAPGVLLRDNSRAACVYLYVCMCVYVCVRVCVYVCVCECTCAYGVDGAWRVVAG